MSKKKAKEAYESNVGRPKVADHLRKVPLSASVRQATVKHFNKSEVKPGEVLDTYVKNAIESNLSGKIYKA